MNDVPHPTDEPGRVSRLANYRILDTRPDTTFDRIARIASLTMGTPMAVVGLIDASRVWFKARVGIEIASVSRLDAICPNLLNTSDPLVVTDAREDPAFCAISLVVDTPHIRFYAGVPLRTADGVTIGSLATMDIHARPAPTAAQLTTLTELAALAVEEIELRAGHDGDMDTNGQGSRQTEPAPHQTEPAPRLTEPARSTHRNLLAAYAAKSEFLTSLSHELRTPLNAIVGYAGLIAGSDDTPHNTADHAGEITAAARHMLALVNDILEYSRLEAGNMSIGWQKVMVGPIVEAALHMVAVFATSRGIQLSRDLAWADATVRGDPIRLKQVLLNLLTNAIKFTPRGGSVTVHLTPGANGHVEITVRDTGIGIAEADIPKTLIPFGQIVPKEGAQTEGTGLGLPIAKALIERQGGSLTLESRLGQGTTVRIHLPPLHPPLPLQPNGNATSGTFRADGVWSPAFP